MKAMTKQQLAQCAGVTVRTLFNWLRPYRKELSQPNITAWIAEKFGIDV